MSKLARAIQEQCVKPIVEDRRPCIKGRILEYHKETNTAKIGYTSPKTGDNIETEGVYVATESQGVIGTSLKEGDEVLIAFLDGANNLPIIIKFLDRYYANNTKNKSKHDRKGAFLPDFFCER